MSLMSLPFELRAQVLDLVLNHQSERPAHPDEAGQRSNTRDHNGREMRYWYKVMYQDDSATYIVGSASLLLVSRQLRDETRTQMARIKDRACYELDVIVNAERNLLPTWTRVPAVTRNVDDLSINFRVFGDGLGREGHHRVWNSSYGAPPIMTCNIYKLLERFFSLGASAPRSDTFNGSYQFAVKCLNINVDRTTDTKPYCYMSMDCHPITTSRLTPWEEVLGDVAYTWHPERYCRFIQAEFANLLDMSRRTAEFGSVLYRNVGSIKLTLAGVPVYGFDLGRMLSALSVDETLLMFGRTQVNASEWKAETIGMRKARGLVQAA